MRACLQACVQQNGKTVSVDGTAHVQEEVILTSKKMNCDVNMELNVN